MKIEFNKYSSTGNDFILLDNRQGIYSELDANRIKNLCDRRFGVGADGVILLENSSKADFYMNFYNADGSKARFCGNGSRAIIHFFSQLSQLKGKDSCLIEIEDEVIKAEIKGEEVIVSMPEIKDLNKVSLEEFGEFKGSLYVDTGVPHALFWVDEDFDSFDLAGLFEKLNCKKKLFSEGVNVSVFEMINDQSIRLRTKERGVALETYACGTAAVASAIAVCELHKFSKEINVQVKGGKLKILLSDDYKKLNLCGKTENIFKGEMELL